jgi:hypothetical protein
MAILALFKKPTAPLTPARDALRSKLVARAKIQNRRQATSERISAARRDADDAAAAATAAQSAQGLLDQAAATGRYTGTSPDLEPLQRALREAHGRHERLADVGRAATLTISRWRADLEESAADLAKLNGEIPALLHAALIESLADHVEEFEKAETQLRAIHRKVFTVALAADRVALTEHLGTFCDSSTFHDLCITRPNTYAPVYSDDYARGKALETAIAERAADTRRLETEADLLVNGLLSTTDN